MEKKSSISTLDEVLSAILDMDGGLFLLVVIYELATELLALEDPVGAAQVLRKIFTIVEVEFEMPDDAPALQMLSEVLYDAICEER